MSLAEELTAGYRTCIVSRWKSAAKSCDIVRRFDTLSLLPWRSANTNGWVYVSEGSWYTSWIRCTSRALSDRNETI